MGRFNYLSDPVDGFIFSTDLDYVVAANDGAAFQVNLTADVVGAGQNGLGGFGVREGFTQFTIAPVDVNNFTVTSAFFALMGLVHAPTGANWSVEVRDYDWGPTLTSADWVRGIDLGDHPLLADFPYIRSQRPAPYVWRGGNAAFRARVSGDPVIKLMLHSSKQRLLRAPTGNGDEYIDIGSFEYAEGPYRPRIEYCTTTKSSLTQAAAASVQLSDGTHVFLELVAGVPTLKHNPSGAIYNTIGTLGIGNDTNQFALQPGAQAFSLTRDSRDNIFVVGPAGAFPNGLAIKAFAKGAGYSWTGRNALSGQLGFYDEPVNQTAAAWHDIGTGWIVTQFGHCQGHDWDNQVGFVTMSCLNALLGSGSAFLDIRATKPIYTASSVNHTGNGLDVMALSRGSGVAVQINSDAGYWETNAGARLYRYTISSSGIFTTVPTQAYNGVFNMPTDGDAKAKIIPISATRFAVFWYGYLRAFSVAGTSIVTTSSVNLMDAGISSLANNAAQPMDAIYDRATQTVQVYYFDQANSRRLMRTGFNPSTSLLDLTQTEVITNTGPAGSSNRAIRLPRGSVDERRLLIDLGNRSGGGVDSLIHVESTQLNQIPNVPVLNNPGIVSGTIANTFSWSFSDNNPADTQSAYEVEIRDQSSLVSVYDPGKVISGAQAVVIPASTLSNVEVYEWRVKTYDGADNASVFSAWQAFSTVASGVVLIVDPVSDNLAGFASPRLTVTWSYTVTAPLTQESYRVRVVRTDNGDTVFDSGYIYGPLVTSYQVTGLITDIEQRIEVLVKDSGGAISNTAQRLVTPSFGAPDVPLLMAQALEDGSGVLVTVANPTPTGDLPPSGRNDVYRALSGSGRFIKVGEAAPGEVFNDYGVAADVVYDYQVYAVADGETPSEIVAEVSTTFSGIYIHNPADADLTVRHFLYGGSVNSENVSPSSTELRFAGRAYPVFEYGEQLSETVKVTITVPFDEEWNAGVAYLREVARSQAVHCYRDSRGRRVFGVVNGASIADERVGSTVDLSVIRVDYSEELP